MSNFRYVRPEGFPPIVKNLIIINVLFFVATDFLLQDKFSLPEAPGWGLLGVFALWPIDSLPFRPYQIFTHMFTHGGIAHIFFNMFNLYIFGRILENVWGPKKFLFFYLFCGVVAAATHLIVQALSPETALPTVGASGAVMGVMVGFAYLFPNTELMLMFIPVPIKAKYLILGLIAIDLFGGFGRLGATGIAHWAHLGGGLAGFLLVYIWNKRNRRTFY